MTPADFVIYSGESLLSILLQVLMLSMRILCPMKSQRGLFGTHSKGKSDLNMLSRL